MGKYLFVARAVIILGLFMACSTGLNDSDVNPTGSSNIEPEFITTTEELSDTVSVGQTFLCTLKVSDADSDDLTLEIFNTIVGPVLGESNELTWTPALADTGIHSIFLKVSDGLGGTDTLTFTIVVTIAFTGFDFILAKGDFWDFDVNRSGMSGFGTYTWNYDGRIRILLGDPIIIDSIQAFTVILSGDTNMLSTRWKYLAMHELQFLGSENGNSLTVLFDGGSGMWPGSGFFGTFSSTTLYQARKSEINNKFLSDDALLIGASTSQSRCRYYSGIGTICGGDADINVSHYEYFKEGIGPYGHYDHSSYMDYYTQTSNTNRAALSRSSLRGDSPITEY